MDARRDEKFNQSAYEEYLDFAFDNWPEDQPIDPLLDLEDRLGLSAFDDGSAPDMGDVSGDLGALNEILTRGGVEVPEQFGVTAVQESRNDKAESDLELREFQERRIGAAGPVAGTAGALIGGFGAQFTHPENLATLAIGAPARIGFWGTLAIESALNAGIEAGITPSRNAYLEAIGDEPESVWVNALFGAAFGAGFVALFKGPGALIRTLKGGGTPEERRTLAKGLQDTGRADAQAVGARIARDLDDAAAAATETDVLSAGEARQRETRAAVGEPQPDRPIFDTAPGGALLYGAVDEVRAADLKIMPGQFQFKSDADASGVTDKLRNDPEWDNSLSGRVIVYEFKDGTRAIVDGHQRVSLAQRIMKRDPSQDIRLLAEVLRESDGVSVEAARVAGAIKNIAEAADGMTAAMARDAAKVLRVAPEVIENLPVGPGTIVATHLTRLSDDAFGLFINEVVPQNFSAAVGRMVEDKALHLPIMRLLERLKPANLAQAESIIDQALNAPRTKEVTSDLFGESVTTESLFAEKAKVLDRALRILGEDKATFRTLTERGDRITSAGENRLDQASNAAIRQTTETAMALVKKLAHRAGPISEALNDGAKSYKDTGKIKDAAQAVADAVRRGIERGDLDGATGSRAGPDGDNQGQSAQAPDHNAAVGERGSEAQREQVAANPIRDTVEPEGGQSADEVVADAEDALNEVRADWEALEAEVEAGTAGDNKLDLYMTLSAALSDARRVLADALAATGMPARLETRNGKLKALVGPRMDGQPGARITYLDDKGPSGDTHHDSFQAAYRDALDQGYEKVVRPIADEPREAFQDDSDLLSDLAAIVETGIEREVIDNHPAVVQALEDMAARPETRDAPGYDSDDWHATRSYDFDGETVTGTAEAVPRWVAKAREQAGETGQDRTATIVLGPPAAGKSTVANKIAKAQRAAIIDPDDIKATLPEYDGGIGANATHEESSDLANALMDGMMAEGENLVIPKVGGNEASIARVIAKLREAGYVVRVASMAVEPAEAYRRMILRFVNTGRLIAPEYVDAVGDKPAAVFRSLRDQDAADGFAEIDNNGGIDDPKAISEIQGENPFDGTSFGLPAARTEPGAGTEPGNARGGVEGPEVGERQTDLEDLIAERDPDNPTFKDLFDTMPGDRLDDAGDVVFEKRNPNDVAAELDEIDETLDIAEVCLK